VAADLRLRPVPELQTCLVYRPRPPALLMLDLGAWLLLEILIEQPDVDPWPAFCEAVRHACSEPRARALMDEGLQQLARLELIRSEVDHRTNEGERDDRAQ
jgi:hypothetical protein